MTRGGWVYMMADRYRGAIYTGVIVLGVLLALGAQQVMQWVQTQRDVQTFRETIDQEIAYNLWIYRSRAGEAAFGRGAAVLFGDAVEGARLRHLALGADGIALLEQLVEGGADALVDRILERLGQIGETGVAVDRLEIAEQIVGEPAGPCLQRLDRLDHRGDED